MCPTPTRAARVSARSGAPRPRPRSSERTPVRSKVPHAATARITTSITLSRGVLAGRTLKNRCSGSGPRSTARKRGGTYSVERKTQELSSLKFRRHAQKALWHETGCLACLRACGLATQVCNGSVPKGKKVTVAQITRYYSLLYATFCSKNPV